MPDDIDEDDARVQDDGPDVPRDMPQREGDAVKPLLVLLDTQLQLPSCKCIDARVERAELQAEVRTSSWMAVAAASATHQGCLMHLPLFALEVARISKTGEIDGGPGTFRQQVQVAYKEVIDPFWSDLTGTPMPAVPLSWEDPSPRISSSSIIVSPTVSYQSDKVESITDKISREIEEMRNKIPTISEEVSFEKPPGLAVHAQSVYDGIERGNFDADVYRSPNGQAERYRIDSTITPITVEKGRNDHEGS